ncbi:RNase J family beta-CASP ribonuclease [Heliobacterium undosum]|uniref:Ribonuclease J n=1 Tax=Heliomicrobium undosum TaxID=121734 RepID=A0A845L4C5_9FIRM|nr:ribonuclease J [Heliomicrobium undosum]MZP31143.1 RNase J family beta-CASP ribonuclease [Heliomicrobium undosum]
MGAGEKVSIIPLGGLGEIGKNMTIIKVNQELLIIDCGIMFPEDEMLGIDVVIPDITYLIENRDAIRGIILTHGHEDHIGALPYMLKELKVPVYGTRLTLALAETYLKEQNMQAATVFHTVKPREIIRIGAFRVEFIRVCHSIPDAVAVAIHTPAGVILHTGDFKFDQTPVDDEATDYYRLAQLGESGVLALLSDSTNAEKTGFTPSEKAAYGKLEEVFRLSKGRIIVTTFASSLYRIQQAFQVAARYRRKVVVVGKSMQEVVQVARANGYLEIPPGTLCDEDNWSAIPHDKLVLLTTGHLGEPMSGLMRGPWTDARLSNYQPGDTVIISASPVAGSEKSVHRTIDGLCKLGADVYHEASGGHISGHASQEELKMMINLIRPKYFVPIQGEYRMLIRHARVARDVGVSSDNIFVLENGQVLELTPKKGSLATRVAAGRVLVDGLGVGDVGNIVLRDRRQLSQDGILIVVITISKESGQVVAGPDMVSRGFVYVREAEELMEEAKIKVRQALEKSGERRVTEWAAIKTNVHDVLSKFLYEKTRRRPMILPIIMEV